MALRAVRLVVQPGAAVFRLGAVLHTARIHSGGPKNLQCGWWAYALGERTMPRFKENSKIFSIDGNLASGKGALAQKLADKLGMLYMPEPDTHYLDKVTGESQLLDMQFNGNCSLEKFYKDPKAPDGNSYRLQSWMYHVRLLQYSDAIEHLLTTGQGVILERSPFSDLVFLEAMFKQGYIRKQCVEHYNEIKGISICEFLPPHLVIYVDVPAEEVQKKLKQTGKPELENVPVAYLKKDIEYLKFDKGPWLEQDDVTFHYMRMLVEDKQRVADLTCIPRFLPEVTIGAHEYDKAYHDFKSLPGKKYAPGYNADVGDKNIWLK
uniref:NADH dehydrogenase [ubiquinone] 1 alpha subcomplex subunit 10, mitochondrial n=1 Tax=Scleropages formosus TaxID=113540 RepID=A0A8C9VFC6_SCLFO